MSITRNFLLARKIKKAGFQNALATVQEAARAGLPLSAACALLEKESARGQNVFGHDPVRNPIKGGAVTKTRYLQYKHYRKAGLGMQGVGPCQLTWYASQDAADAMGGCWKPRFNMRVGFRQLRDNIKAHGFERGAAAYNGSGPAADAYGRDFEVKRNKWHTYLS